MLEVRISNTFRFDQIRNRIVSDLLVYPKRITYPLGMFAFHLFDLVLL